MVISSAYFTYLNLALIILYLAFVVIGYKNGLILQIVDLVYNILALFIGYFLAPILASHFPIVKLDEVYMALKLNVLMDTLIYMIIVFILLKLLYLIIKPMFGFVSKIPLIGFVNDIGGALMGIVNATIVVLLFCMLLNTPLFKNGNEVKEKTYLKTINGLSYKALEFSMDHFDFQKEFKDFDIDKTRMAFDKWLEEQGVFDE
ncbi:MAG: CvpA family protein [Erysipelotrichaceae bacterium]|nr:CvpA family protein [Solobacterium sp.]MDD7776458.1 CvpA family protein [Solobacterium sp.]MDY2952710.1 CvpA family protein [Erysipelotrichaceae bacterium]MDY5276418.1 CvpA family protein [Erysipelotrichaceae bacterium]MDY5401221.1 CvpA family protein [Erysipelotrichaceae bacterium]